MGVFWVEGGGGGVITTRPVNNMFVVLSNTDTTCNFTKSK